MAESKLTEPQLSGRKLPEPRLPEPWLRGTLTEVPAVQRAVLHALELAEEDLRRWCGGLTEEEINFSPSRLPRWHFICAILRAASTGC